jgi:hypothetical protein
MIACAFGIALICVFALYGCGGGGSSSPTATTATTRTGSAHGTAADEADRSLAATVGCEGITADSRWRSHTIAVGNFGLFVEHLASQAARLSNGNYLVKAGAVVRGDEPVALRIPRAVRGTVGLVYGDASRGRQRSPSAALTQVTFRPCAGKPRSGYVGGLIFAGKPRTVTLEVVSNGTAEPIRLPR